MSRNENCPFERGTTFYGQGATIDSANLGGVNLEGKEYLFENSPGADTTNGEPSGRQVLCRCVRNVSGVALKPGRIATYHKADDPYGTRVDGYTFALADEPAGIVDEFLPAAGVQNYDLFWLVIKGPTKVKQLNSGQSNLAIGDRLVPAAGGSSKTDDLAGRVAKQDLTGATATLGNNVQNSFGRATLADNTANDLVAALVNFPDL